MTLQRLYKTLTLTLTLTLALTSCGNNGCEVTRESYLYTSFKATGRLSLKSVYAWALTTEGDSLMTSASSPTEMEFMLKPDTTITQIRLQCTIDDAGEQEQIDDTLVVAYDHYPYFIDMECGCSVFFDIKEVSLTDHFFKSLTLKNKQITNEENVNLLLTY